MAAPASVTDLLNAWHKGDESALESLVPLVYDELRQIARRHLRREREGHTLEPTALVHEAYARLIDQAKVPWKDRAHFFAIAARTMRRILVEHARKRRAVRRGGDGFRVTLDGVDPPVERHDVDVIQLDDALNELNSLDARQAQLVELRYFAGLSIKETAVLLGISPATVKREWLVARAWLYCEITKR
jgi:RNA polymerase sigma-70 factor (ECF subfamily)